MSTRKTILITATLILLATLAGIFLWNRLPDPMASHWGIYDQVNGTTTKFWGVFLMPLIMALLLALFLAIPTIDPLKANIAKFRNTFNALVILLIAFLMYTHVLTLAWNLGYNSFRMSTALVPAIGLLMIFLGMLIRNAKRNFFIGIRTPWTLSSDTVWSATHHLGGPLFMISGFIALIGFYFPDIAVWFLIIPLIATTLFSVVYSYVLFQREAQPA